MLHIDKAKEIWIYGAGSRAKVLAEYLREEGVDARGFVVSDDQPLVDGAEITISKHAGGGYYPFNVVRFGALSASSRLDKIQIINSVNASAVPELADHIDSAIASAGADPAIHITKKENIGLSISLLDYLIKKFGGSRGDGVIKIGSVVMADPLAIDRDYATEILPSICDIIIPPLFDDMSYAWNGPYEKGAVSLEPGAVVVDGGANLGVFSAYAASRGCTVYAVEPDSAAIAVLKEQAKIHDGAIKIVPFGLSEREQVLTFHRSSSSLHSSLNEIRGEVETTSLECTTIDRAVETGLIGEPDFIKLGIMGSEIAAIRGSAATIKRARPKIAASTSITDSRELAEAIADIDDRYDIETDRLKLYARSTI